MSTPSLVALGARIPEDLKEEISSYCEKNGVKMQFFVTQALREKVRDVLDTMMDNKLADARLRTPEMMEFLEFEKRLSLRKKKS